MRNPELVRLLDEEIRHLEAEAQISMAMTHGTARYLNVVAAHTAALNLRVYLGEEE